MATQTEAMKLALDALKDVQDFKPNDKTARAIKALEETLAKQSTKCVEQGAPVAVKHMMEWVDYLKRKSDYGQHMKIPSEMSAGACWELAVELEQFINTTPQQRTWVGLTSAEWSDLYEAHHDKYNQPKQGNPDGMDYERAIEAKLKDKNT